MIEQPQNSSPEHKKKLIIVTAIGVLASIAIGVAVYLFLGVYTSSQTQQNLSVFGKRYDDACKLVSDDVVQTAFPNVISPTTSVASRYLSNGNADATTNEDSQTVSCSYLSYGRGDEPDPQFTATITYFKNSSSAQEAWTAKTGDAIRANGVTLREEKKKLEEKLADPSTSPTEQKITAQALALAQEALVNNERNIRRFEGERKLVVAGVNVLVIPFDSTFYVVDDNALIATKYVPDPSKDQAPLTATSPLSVEQKTALRQNMEKLIAAILQKRASEAADSTPIDGIRVPSKQIGSTKLFNPCELLSADLYNSAVGQPSDPAVIIESTQSQNLTATPRVNGKVVLERNTCSRSHAKHDKEGNPKTALTLKLEMQYAATAADANELYQEYRTNRPEKQLQTDGGTQFPTFTFANYEGTYGVMAIHGPYVVLLSYGIPDGTENTTAVSADKIDVALAQIIDAL